MMNFLSEKKHFTNIRKHRVVQVSSALIQTSQTDSSLCVVSLQQRSGEAVKVHQLDVAIPLQLKSQLKKGQPCISEGDSDISDTMQFVMLTRKGNKQQVRWHLCAKLLHFFKNQAGHSSLLQVKSLFFNHILIPGSSSTLLGQNNLLRVCNSISMLQLFGRSSVE